MKVSGLCQDGDARRGATLTKRGTGQESTPGFLVPSAQEAAWGGGWQEETRGLGGLPQLPPAHVQKATPKAKSSKLQNRKDQTHDLEFSRLVLMLLR